MREHMAAGNFPRPVMPQLGEKPCAVIAIDNAMKVNLTRNPSGARGPPALFSSERTSASQERQNPVTWQRKQRLHKFTTEILICFARAEMGKSAGGPVGLQGDARHSRNRLSGTLGEPHQKCRGLFKNAPPIDTKKIEVEESSKPPLIPLTDDYINIRISVILLFTPPVSILLLR